LAIRRLAKAGKVAYGAGHLVRAMKAAKPIPPQAATQPSRGKTRAASTVHSKKESVLAESGTPQRAFPTAHGKNIIVGTFRRTSKGFGFVRPQGAKRGDRAGDIYIAAGATMDASDRDVVRVRLGRNSARGKGGV